MSWSGRQWYNRAEGWPLTQPSEADQQAITYLLRQVREGNKQVEDKLLQALYAELHRIAEFRLSGEQNARSLRPTELVNEVYLRLIAGSEQSWQDRSHFYATAARAMRNIIIDYIRGKSADKRGGGLARVELEDGLAITAERFDEVLAIQEALDRLEKLDPEQTRIVDLRYFGGFRMQEIAAVLNMPLRTVEREWEDARRWLYAQLNTSGRRHESRTLAAH